MSCCSIVTYIPSRWVLLPKRKNLLQSFPANSPAHRAAARGRDPSARLPTRMRKLLTVYVIVRIPGGGAVVHSEATYRGDIAMLLNSFCMLDVFCFTPRTTDMLRRLAADAGLLTEIISRQHSLEERRALAAMS